jgi:hypothetical protein
MYLFSSVLFVHYDAQRTAKVSCGIFKAPFTLDDQCTRVATRMVTDATYLAYRDFRIRWHRRNPHDDLPILHWKLICQYHLNQLRSLPDDPVQRTEVS